jgi:hypothetical protein
VFCSLTIDFVEQAGLIFLDLLFESSSVGWAIHYSVFLIFGAEVQFNPAENVERGQTELFSPRQTAY